MVSTAIVHVIGTATFVVILLFIIAHTRIMMDITTYNIEKNALENIANSISYQILYMISQNTNITYSVYHPVMLNSKTGYNIIIATATGLESQYTQISGLNTSYLYLMVATPSGIPHVIKQVCPLNYYGKTIVLAEDPIMISSTIDFKLNITVINNEIIVKPVIIGVIAR